MALHTLGQIRIPSTYDAVFVTNRIARMFWDDVALSIRVFVYESDGTEVQEATTGPTIQVAGSARALSHKTFNYSFCDSTDLNSFQIIDNSGSNVTLPFPYYERVISENHWSCQLITCDIIFNTLVTSSTADSGAADGTITVQANTSYGEPRYSRDPNATYDTADAPTSGSNYTFTGLAAGTYTIYALDQYNCRAQITAFVPATEAAYGVRFRLEYNDVQARGTSRIDIEEKEYVGAMSEVCGGGDPFVLKWRGESIEDLFTTFIASECELNFISAGDFSFIDIFTSDERKYRVKYYRDTGAGFSLKWTGFILPMLYSEQYYTTKNYPVSFVATDQIGTLKDLDFVDDFGNPVSQQISILDAICIILRKTDININMMETVNIFEVGMGTYLLNFENPSFVDTIYPWVNISGFASIPFVWASGNIVTCTVTPFNTARELAQIRPDSTENWPTGNYSVSVTIQQSGATSGIEIFLVGFVNDAGVGFNDFGTIGTKSEGVYENFSQTIDVTQSLKYLAVGVRRVSGNEEFTVSISDISISTSPSFGADASALQQAFIDTDVYYDNDGAPKKCDYVLNKLLISFGARLYQADGLWRIDLIEAKAGTNAYRIFNLLGELQSSGTTQNVITIQEPIGDYFSFIERSGILSITPFYGRITFNILNSIDNNLLTRGDFEKRDIVSGQFVGWSFDISNGPGTAIGYEQFREPVSGSVGGLVVDFSNTDSGAEIIMTAEQFNLSAVQGQKLLLSLDVFFRPYFLGFWNYIDISIKIGDKFVVPGRLPTSVITGLLVDDEYIRLYIDKSLEWKNIAIDVNAIFRGVSTLLEGPVILKMRLNNQPLYDFASIAALKAFVTDDKIFLTSFDWKANVLDGATIRIYQFETGTDAEDSPDIIRPDDYNGTTNARVWKLLKSVSIPNTDFLLDSILIDNVTLSFVEEFENISYVKEFNPDVKLDLEKDILHTDIAIYESDIENPDDTDDNDLRLVKNYIRLNSGVATKHWSRSYLDGEDRSLMDILMRMYQGQITTPSYKFSGSFLTLLEPSFFNAFYAPHVDKNFIAMYLALHDKSRKVDGELLELKTSADGEPPPADIFEFTEEFTTEFDA